MKARMIHASALALVLVAMGAQAADEENILISKPGGDGPVKWSEYLVDSGAGSVSAAGMLGISGESITTVENVRDVVVAVKGLDNNGSKATLALSVTPARTELLPVSYHAYRNNVLARLWGSFTIGYAQGDADVSGTKFERRAVSAETSLFLSPEKDDLVVVFAERLKRRDYPPKLDDKGNPVLDANGNAQPSDPCDYVRDPGVIEARGTDWDPVDQKDDPITPAPGGPLGGGNKPKPDMEKLSKAHQKIRNACYADAKKGMRWNKSRVSVAYATGWIKGKDGAIDEESLGHTVAASFSYGHGEDPTRNAWQLALTYRHSFDEPVLETLGTAAVNEKDTSLVVGQIKYGSEKIRALVEASNARSDDVTASQRAFRQAVGVDFRVMENTWLNFRYGRQREVDGDGDENGSLLTISYSPSALLQ